MANIQEWEWYQSGINYNNRLEPSFYDLVDCNWDFFYGDQWRNAGLSKDYPQPVFNYINKYVTFFVANILSSRIGVTIESPFITEESKESDSIVNQAMREFEERVKMDWQTKNAAYNGAITGDFVGHIIFNPEAKPYGGTLSEVMGQLEFELVDPNNFYVGNPNSCDIQTQPWIQVAGRDLVQSLKDESKEVGENQAESIVSDEDTEEQASKYGQIELEDITADDGKDTGKATYVITYCKKKAKGSDVKTVHASKCVQGSYIYKDIDLEVELYPVALGNWELQRNTYHGMSFVQGIIPAQIFINRGFAMAMKNTIDTAFSKFLYDESAISGVSNRVATQTAVKLKPGQRLSDVATFIAPGSMSAQVMQMIDMSKSYMAEVVGANDALLGNVSPEQASGVSIAAASKQSGIPLENPKTNIYNWREDIARIVLDQMTHLYGERPVIVTDEEGETTVEMFDFNSLTGMYKTVTVDVGPSSYWSEIASIQTLDNLLDRGLIELIDYLERMPDGYIKEKQGLIDNLMMQTKESEGEMDEATKEFLSGLTPEEQEAFMQLPPEQQQQYIQGGQANEV